MLPCIQGLHASLRILIAELDGNVEFAFVNPNASDEKEREAREAGIRPVTVNVRQQNKMTQKRVYLGAVFQYQGQREVVPFVEPNSAMEHTIASTMKKLTATSKPVLGVLQGHGEPGLNAMTQLQSGLKGRHDIQTVSGVDTAGVPPEVDVLLVARPENQLSTEAALAVDQYVMRGGPAIFALNRARTNMRFGQARPKTTGLEPLLDQYGLPIRPDLVRDRNASAVRVRQKRGGFTVMNRVRYPYIPQIGNFANHPISSGLDQAVFRFVSSQQSALASLPGNVRPQQDWTVADFSGGLIPRRGPAGGDLLFGVRRDGHP